MDPNASRANGWRWRLAEAKAANYSIRYSSTLWSQFACPKTITRPERTRTTAERMGGGDA